ncbi:MAG: hypothetical protein ABEK50_14340 [bacterium]
MIDFDYVKWFIRLLLTLVFAVISRPGNANQKVKHVKTLNDLKSMVTGVDFNQNGKVIAVGKQSGDIVFLNEKL